MKRIAIIALLLLFSAVVVYWLMPKDEIDYNTQVKPILNKHCISCHGGVKQNGGFSLLFEEDAKGNTAEGRPAIIPGHASRSEMFRRLISKDPEERMPYEKDPLSKGEIRILKEWINQGAQWDTHWAYKKVEETVPSDDIDNSEYTSWSKNDIDYYVYEKIKELEQSPAEEADKSILARRLSLDLIGLPVEMSLLEESSDLDAFVDQLLSSKHFGEKWAAMWMDLARYSDTKGYERDDSRTIWKYRDWLIKAFNEDKPYNQFLVDQLAGDLLPNPTDDQLIATAFHRNTMTNDEGGTDNEEFRIAAVLDRVNTTWEVTMGTTFACVQCHSHPYDPFTLEEYYEFTAFFNNSRDEDTFHDYPVFRHFEGEDSIQFKELTAWLDKNANDERAGEISTFLKTWQPSFNSLTSDQFVNSELADTKWLVFRNNGSSRLKNVDLSGKNRLIYRYRSFLPGGLWKIHLDAVDGPVIKTVEVDDTKRRWEYNEISIEQVEGAHDLYFTYSNPNLKNPLSNGLMFDWFYFTEDFPGEGSEGYPEAKENFWQLATASTLQTPIMMENPGSMMRETRIFERGNFLSPADLVTSETPAIMNEFPSDQPKNRLGLAYWLASTNNPLTARIYVNRIWEQLFGHGIVSTLEDFGSQGEAPSHQQLLDHLAWKFMHDFEWSTKELLRYIVLSATYRQSSFTTPEKLEADPQNKYLTRGPRIRLTAEQVRDQALVVSGLFNDKMYGPSVMPYQPDGIWNSPYSNKKWIQSEGDEQYRRALYTYWKRTSPYPSMLIFDAMAREVCNSRRISTNTPLQALVTLNDDVYVEASRSLAQRMISEGGTRLEDQLVYGYQLMMNKNITDEKLGVLVNLYKELHNPGIVRQVSYTSGASDESNLETMYIIANSMMNLDEFLMKN